MWLIDTVQIAGTEVSRNISIPDTWFYGVINAALLAVVVWGILRWVGKMDVKMDKVDATFKSIDDTFKSVNSTLLLHGQMHQAHAEMFKNLVARFEKIELRLEKQKP